MRLRYNRRMYIGASLISILGLLLAAELTYAAPGDMEKAQTIIVLDNPEDEIDGRAFISTLEAYISDVGVAADLAPIADAPTTHDGWVALAKGVGATHGALAVLWFETEADAGEACSVYLVLLEQTTGAVVVLPVKLGLRQGPTMFRVLAATTRMVIDTELLDDIREISDISRQDPPPEPWPAKTPGDPIPPLSTPPSPAPAPKARTFEINLGYLGDFGHGGPTVLHGARLGVFARLIPWLAPGIDLGFLLAGEKRVLDIDVGQRRLPIRVALAGFVPVGPTEAIFIAFWTLEPVWVSASVIRSAPHEAIDPTTQVDTGGGGELRWRFRISSNVGLFAAVSGQAMVVSHAYERGGEVTIHPSYFRLGWTAGIDLFNL
ncbi:MAG: hypothetical protein GY854_08255 [Deltaproteobacteria bacterium]|nr:hypothetical protein [Deltaproteobacteria bacterium]